MTVRALSARLSALEGRGVPADGPLVIEVVLVAQDGRRTDWNAHAPEVVVSGTPYPVGADETASMAVERVVAGMRPQPRGVVALVALDEQA